MSSILSSNDMVESISSDFISFKDCPNHCIDGKIFDPFTHKKVICEYCANKRKEFVKNSLVDKDTNKSLYELLDLPASYTGTEFSTDLVIPKFARKDIEQDSLDVVFNKLEELMTNISIGILSDYSILFNLGKKANEINFIYPYLMKGYIAGRSLVPLINASDLYLLRLNYEGYNSDIKLGKNYKYNDILTRDLCVIVIDAGATYISLNSVKGVMQLRAYNQKSTIIFTNAWGTQVKDLCADNDYNCLNLATLYSVKYKNDDSNTVLDNYSTSINSNMSSQDLKNLMLAKNSL